MFVKKIHFISLFVSGDKREQAIVQRVAEKMLGETIVHSGSLHPEDKHSPTSVCPRATIIRARGYKCKLPKFPPTLRKTALGSSRRIFLRRIPPHRNAVCGGSQGLARKWALQATRRHRQMALGQPRTGQRSQGVRRKTHSQLLA